MKTAKNGFLFAYALLILAAGEVAGAQSLWNPGFSGYLSSKTALRVGDIVRVQIDASSSLSFEATTTDAKNITFDFSGGEFGNLFSFLPSAQTGGSQSTRGGQDYTLETEIGARIAEIDETGKARLQGTRSFALENKEELVSISGWIDPGTLGPDRRISFSQLADSQLRFRTFLEPAGQTLSAADIQEVIEVIERPAAGAPAAGAAPAPPTAGLTAAGTATEERRSYQLSQDKKIELFLSYINRMVDLLFQ
jgi:hypothetical protein